MILVLLCNVHNFSNSKCYIIPYFVTFTSAQHIIESFGITTTNTSSSLFESSETIKITLWFDNIVYQCDVLPPINASTNYTCDLCNWNIYYNSCTEYKIMIDNDETGHELLIDKVYVNIENDTFYGIDGICIHNGTDIKSEKRIGSKYVDQFNTTQSIQICGINTVHSNIIGVDQSIDYKPGKQIIGIDIDRPNEWINNARWSYKHIGSQCDIFSENYILVQQHLSWNESQTYCNIHYETDLASIHDDIQNTEAMRLCDVGAYYPNCHIGLNDIDNESFSSKNGWIWIDGTEYGAYHHWDDGDHPEPSQQEGKINEDCVEIRGAGGTWNDIE